MRTVYDALIQEIENRDQQAAREEREWVDGLLSLVGGAGDNGTSGASGAAFCQEFDAFAGLPWFDGSFSKAQVEGVADGLMKKVRKQHAKKKKRRRKSGKRSGRKRGGKKQRRQDGDQDYGRLYKSQVGAEARRLLAAAEDYVLDVLNPDGVDRGGRVVSSAYAWRICPPTDDPDHVELEQGRHRDEKPFYKWGGLRLVFSLRVSEEGSSFGFRVMKTDDNGVEHWGPFVPVTKQVVVLSSLTSGFEPFEVGGENYFVQHARFTTGVSLIVDVIHKNYLTKVLTKKQMIGFNNPCEHQPISGLCLDCHDHLRCPHAWWGRDGGGNGGGYQAKQSGCLLCCVGAKWICGHGRRKTECGDCKGRTCAHGDKSKPLRKTKHCVICTPSLACVHEPGKAKINCSKCTPSRECPHEENQAKSNCVLCSLHLQCPFHPGEHVRHRCPLYFQVRKARKKRRKNGETIPGRIPWEVTEKEMEVLYGRKRDRRESSPVASESRKRARKRHKPLSS